MQKLSSTDRQEKFFYLWDFIIEVTFTMEESEMKILYTVCWFSYYDLYCTLLDILSAIL